MPTTAQPRSDVLVAGLCTATLAVFCALTATNMITVAVALPPLAVTVLLVALAMVFLTAAFTLAARRGRRVGHLTAAFGALGFGAASDIQSLAVRGFSQWTAVSLALWVGLLVALTAMVVYRRRHRRS